jgi:hypothetical protein
MFRRSPTRIAAHGLEDDLRNRFASRGILDEDGLDSAARQLGEGDPPCPCAPPGAILDALGQFDLNAYHAIDMVAP